MNRGQGFANPFGMGVVLARVRFGSFKTLGLLALLAGCYGPGVMGWGSNGTSFEVDRQEGFVEVTAVGRGPMKPVSSGASPEYEEKPPEWADFALQFESAGVRAAFNYPAGATSPEIPAERPWSLSNVASEPISLGDKMFFCHAAGDAPPYRFGALVSERGSGPVDYNLWFEQLSKC